MVTLLRLAAAPAIAKSRMEGMARISKVPLRGFWLHVHFAGKRSPARSCRKSTERSTVSIQVSGDKVIIKARRHASSCERPVPEDVRAAFTQSDKYFPTDLQKFQFYDKYSRFNYELVAGKRGSRL